MSTHADEAIHRTLTRHTKDHHPGLAALEKYVTTHGDPIIFLASFLKMRGNRDRGKYAFDYESLEWIARAWQEASIAAVGDSDLRAACLHERDRYAQLAREVFHGSMERKVEGVVFLDAPSDWPRKETIRGAMKALAHAQVAVVQ